MKIDVTQRFWSRVDKSGDCWLWMGTRSRNGHGVMSIGKYKKVGAHRFVWEIHYGEIPPGLCVCHKCDVPNCMNPSHLFLGTRSENIKDMLRKNRHIKGEQSHNAKLTEEAVRAIRRDYVPRAKGMHRGIWKNKGITLPGSTEDLARKYGVNAMQIERVVKRKTWRHVD
jgi:hypothetical protein